ncbi:response regulator [Nostoc sp. CHAB 5834]|nr:response regulator [Nostoc sp. CHAB 5834]
MTKVLVIEDQTETRDIFVDSLEAEGFEAIGAKNGLVGVQKALENLPDLVLCDIMMPELDGYGVLSTLRQDPTTAMIPFIFLTAKATKCNDTAILIAQTCNQDIFKPGLTATIITLQPGLRVLSNFGDPVWGYSQLSDRNP